MMYYFKSSDEFGGAKTNDWQYAKALQSITEFVSCSKEEYEQAMKNAGEDLDNEDEDGPPDYPPRSYGF
jgi:hypothetical protein